MRKIRTTRGFALAMVGALVVTASAVLLSSGPAQTAAAGVTGGTSGAAPAPASSGGKAGSSSGGGAEAGTDRTTAPSTGADQAGEMKTPTGKRRQFPTGLMQAHGVPIASGNGSGLVALEPAPAAVLLVSAHTSGWITPCGCAGSQAGGVARRAGFGDLVRKTFPGLKVFYVDLGGFVLNRTGVEKSTTEAVIESMNRIGYDAVNCGMEDLGYSLDTHRLVVDRLKAPRFSANLQFDDNGKLVYPPYRIFTVPVPGKAPLRIGLLGLLDSGYDLFAFGPDGRSVVAAPMREALDKYLPELRSKSDVVILMAETRPESLYSLVKDVKGIDLAVVGAGSNFILEPLTINDVPYISVGNQGKYLAELRVYGAEGKWLVKPIVHWLDETVPENPELARYAETSLNAINESSRAEVKADASGPADISPYAGSQPCAACHQAAYDVWKGSKHAHAFDVLVQLKRDYTIACVSCHVTGLAAETGGFVNPVASPQLLNVQCEACHGPAASHLEDPEAPYGKVPDTACTVCHSLATDPHFNREIRWKSIAH